MTACFDDYVGKWRGKRFEALPYQHWDDVAWPVRTNQSASDPHRRSVKFSDEKGPFGRPFGDLARALVCELAASRLEPGSYSPFAYLMAALKALYQVVPARGFDVRSLDVGHFTSAEVLARARPHAVGVNIAVKLQFVCDAVNRSRLADREIEWVRSLRNQGDQDDALADPLTDDEIMAWALLSANPPPSTFDRIRQRFVDLAMCGGFRTNEVATMPADPLVYRHPRDGSGNFLLDEAGKEVVHLGLRYWPEKGGSGQTHVKPIPTTMVPIAERAVAEVQELTAGARAAARAHKHGLSPFADGPWAHVREDDLLHAPDVASMLGLSGNMRVRGNEYIRSRIPDAEVHRVMVRGKPCESLVVTRGQLDRALRANSFLGNCVPRENLFVPLHTCLFVLPDQIRIDRDGFQGTAVLITDHQVQIYLANRVRSPSAFERAARGPIRNGEGGRVDFSIKGVRSWLTTQACEGGLHPLDTARWMGWTSLESIRSYDLRDSFTRAESIRRRLTVDGQIAPVAPAEFPALEREEFRFADEEVGHVTPVGMCRRDVDQPPCAAFLAGVASGGLAAVAGRMDRGEREALAGNLETLGRNAAAELASGNAHAQAWSDAAEAGRTLLGPPLVATDAEQR